MFRSLLLVALAMAFALPLAAQSSLDGVMLGSTGPAPAGNAISLFNPDAAALNRVGVTINTYQSLGGGGAGATRDTLGTYVRPGSGFGIRHHASYSPALSAQGRIAFVADWFGPDPSDVQVMAVDRDGRNITVLTDPIRIISSLAGSRIRVDISPDGQTVLYVLAGRQTSGAVPDTMWTVPSDGSASPTAFAFTPLAACEQGAARAVFSPDGTEIAYLGWMQIGTGPDATCELAVRAMDADGANDRVVFGPIERGFNEEWSAEQIALDWKANRILFSWPSLRPGAGSSHPRRVSVLDAISGTILHEVQALTDVDDDSYQLSPDGLAVGYVKQVHPSVNPGQTWVEVRRLSDDTEILNLEAVYTHGSRPFFDWADAPPVPTPARLEIRQDVLLWEGREVDLAPRLLDADGNVISYVVDTWSYERGPVATSFPRINHFTNRIWAGTDGSAPGSGTGNGFDNKVCAQQGGLETCRTHNVVNTPIFDIEILDDDIAEKGRNPGRIRVTRYGPHDETATPQLLTGHVAKHYLDYTLSTLPGVYRWAASSNLADTLQVREITITPIDDAVDEPEIEEADLTLQCDAFPNEANSNCGAARPGQIPGVENGIGDAFFRASLRWRFQIISNGAGSGLALASSTPGVIPASGTATLTINGQGMAAGATATLSGPSSANAVNVTVREGGVQALARFELANAAPGSYDLTVTSGGVSATLTGAVTVDASVPGGTTNVWAVLQSRSSRSGLPLTQYIHYGNDGTADAEMTPLLIAVPEGFEPEFTRDLFQFTDVPEGFDFEQSPWVDQVLRAEDIPELCARAGAAGGAVNCELLAGLGSDIAYKVAVVFLPTIPPGGRGTLGVDMTRLPGARTLPWLVRVGAPFNTLDFDDDVEGVLASVFDSAGPRVVHPTNVQGCTTARLVSADDPSCSGEQAAACLSCLSAGLELLLDASGVGPCAKSAVSAARAVYQTGVDGVVSGSGAAAASGVSAMASIFKAVVECSGSSVPGLAQLKAASRLYNAMTSLSDAASDIGALQNCLSCFGIDVWDVVGRAITADPNDKLGPTGVSERGHVAEFGRMSYTIRYENLPTANASVVELVITDTLDTSVYDLSTFQVGPITVPDTTLIPPSGLRAWTTFWDRRPAVNSIVRVNVDLDDETGIVQWTLSDLNPATFELWTTAEAGFIPPNDDNGAGEGSVQFTIRAKDGLANGTVVANGATIRFDRNELISTPIWGNTLDLGLPSSRASSITPMAGDTTYVVRMTGSDSGSGVHGYDVYAQAPDGPFIYAGSTRSDSLIFTGEKGVTYGLFALATDRVGNAENPKFAAEIFTDGTVDAAEESASSLPRELTLAPPYPNPSSGPVVFQVGLPTSGAVDVRVFDVRGREVAQVLDGELAAGWHRAPWDASALPAGVYVVRAQTPSGVVSSRLTVVR